MTALMLVVVTLAVYRISVFIALDEGPFSIMDSFRSHIDPHQKRWTGRGVRCAGCVSFWVAALMIPILHATVWEWLGMAGGAYALHRMVNK